VTTNATGSFDLNWEDLGHEEDNGNTIGRARITKTFDGDLVGTSVTEIMTVGTAAGPQAYVGIERVEGALHGRKGGFILQHSAGVENGEGWMKWVIVPTSGTGELTGIRGEGQIVNNDGAHSYTLDYESD
jgi:hypothetical protein